MNEFELIERFFKPLAQGYSGSLDLSDDAALISVPAGHELAVTTDAINAGVHFIGDEEPALIARKLLRTNLSDLAAMGAMPLCYFLTLMLPKDTSDAWLQSFTDGLRHDQNEFHIHLAGGDTIATLGPLSLCATALGTVPIGKALKRGGAKPGDIIYVSGTLGDSALGLSSLRAKRSNPDDSFLINRYLLPQPRVTLGQKLIGIASAAIDISDGLAQDLGHICAISKVGAIVHSNQIPLSEAAKNREGAIDAALTGGDDYELLFTTPKKKEAQINVLAAELQLPLIAIGEITEDNTVQLLDDAQKPLPVKRPGFQHF